MKFIVGIIVLVAAFITAITIYLQPNDFIGCDVAPVSGGSCDVSDAIIVVSGGDTTARTQAGIDLYNNGWAPYLIFSGAAQDTSGPSNAETMKQQALQAGVPGRAIIIDENATNTQENAENTQSIFAERDFNNVILVTSGYHQRRASLEFNKESTNTTVRSYPVTADDDWSVLWWLTPRGWWLAGGELVKIIAFHLGVTS